jgi:hypothetical protein
MCQGIAVVMVFQFDFVLTDLMEFLISTDGRQAEV